jgi:hypothetical protein
VSGSENSNRDFTTVGDENLLQLHDAGVGTDVVDGRGLLGLDIVVVKDIVEGKRLLRSARHVEDWVSGARLRDDKAVCIYVGGGRSSLRRAGHCGARSRGLGREDDAQVKVSCGVAT